MMFTMLHGIVVFALSKIIKYSLVSLSFCPIFKNFFASNQSV